MNILDEIERRAVVSELRVEIADNKKPKIRGHAAVFDQKSEDLGGFREIIKPGAFRKTLRDKSDVRALWNHDANYVLGRTKSGTLALKEDKEGLAVDIDPPETSWAADLMRSIERGDVDQMSFAFRAVRQTWDDSDPKNILRELEEVQLFDVSPVTYPAYPQTSVSVREHVQSVAPQAAPRDTPHPAPTPQDHLHLETFRKRHALTAIEPGKEIK